MPYVASSQNGKQIVYYSLQDSLPKFARTSAAERELRVGVVRERIWLFRRPFQAALDALLLGPELVAF